jgi:hypothetical protein
MPTPRKIFTYADLAKQLKVGTNTFQQFVAEERRNRGILWAPDATPAGSRQHFFSCKTAQALKAAFVARRVDKTWKKDAK